MQYDESSLSEWLDGILSVCKDISRVESRFKAYGVARSELPRLIHQQTPTATEAQFHSAMSALDRVIRDTEAALVKKFPPRKDEPVSESSRRATKALEMAAKQPEPIRLLAVFLGLVLAYIAVYLTFSIVDADPRQSPTSLSFVLAAANMDETLARLITTMGWCLLYCIAIPILPLGLVMAATGLFNPTQRWRIFVRTMVIAGWLLAAPVTFLYPYLPRL